MTLNDFMNHGRKERIVDLGLYVACMPTPRLECADGFSISIQASDSTYCTPRVTLDDVSGYSAFELGFPTELDELIEPFQECGEGIAGVFPYVPREVVEQLIEKHGGIQIKE